MLQYFRQIILLIGHYISISQLMVLMSNITLFMKMFYKLCIIYCISQIIRHINFHIFNNSEIELCITSASLSVKWITLFVNVHLKVEKDENGQRQKEKKLKNLLNANPQ